MENKNMTHEEMKKRIDQLERERDFFYEDMLKAKEDLNEALEVCGMYFAFFGSNDLEDRHPGIMISQPRRDKIFRVERAVKAMETFRKIWQSFQGELPIK